MKNAVPCRVTRPAHLLIGGGDPYMTKEEVREAQYLNGTVYSRVPPAALAGWNLPEKPEGYWEPWFRVEKGPAVLAPGQIVRRAMTNHGCYAALIGGSPVVIEGL